MENRLLKTTNDEGGTFTAKLNGTETSTAHVSPVPNKAPGVITAEPGTSKEEAVYYKSKDDIAGTVSGLTRDYTNLNGGVGQDHENGEDWESLQAAEYPNNIIDAIMEGFFLEHQTCAKVTTSSFTVEGNQTAYYTAGRIIRINGSIILTVASSSYSSPNTTVVTNESTISAAITSVEIGIDRKGATNLFALIANIPVKNTQAEMATATDDTKFATALSTAIYGNNSIFRQALVNPNCRICQSVTAVNLTSGKLFGNVDVFYAKGEGTAVSAGTITQATAANVGNSGFALKLAGVTLTGTGIVNAYTFIEAKNAILYKNKIASFSVKVYHDVGSAKNYTIRISKANAADNFSATTEIAVSSAQSVPNTTETLIKLENVSLGDCSNGIEIQVFCECGAITTKNFEFGDWQFNAGAVVLPFVVKNFDQELLSCLRFYQKSFTYLTAPADVNDSVGAFLEPCTNFGVGNSYPQRLRFTVPMRAAPSMTFYSSVGAGAGTWRWYKAAAATSDVAPTVDTGSSEKSIPVIWSGTATALGVSGHWVASARPTIA